MGGWLTDFTTDIYVLGGEGQTITSPFYTLGNEMSLAYDWLPYLRDKFIVTGSDKRYINRHVKSVLAGPRQGVS